MIGEVWVLGPTEGALPHPDPAVSGGHDLPGNIPEALNQLLAGPPCILNECLAFTVFMPGEPVPRLTPRLA